MRLGKIALFGGAVVLLVVIFAAASGSQSASACGNGGPSGPVGGVPAQLIPLYEGAASRYSLGPKGAAVLAGINDVETTFGTNLSTSSAGAVGWMQFEPSTWATYRVTPQGTPAPDGPAGWNDPGDAIYTAARYLQANGAPDWQQAIFAYNHSQAYVDQVLGLADGFYAKGLAATGKGQPTAAQQVAAQQTALIGCTANSPFTTGSDPIPGFTPGRDDMGVDACAKPGMGIYAPAASTLEQVIQDWYAGQPLLLYHFNQLMPGAPSQYWYIAEEVTPITEQTGTMVQAHQEVATFAPAGTCIEIGWGSPTSGQRTLAGQDGDPAAANPAAGSTTVWGETFKRYFGIPWVGTSP